MDPNAMLPDYGFPMQDSVSSIKNGLHHCKEGQDAVHEIVLKTQELFNNLKQATATLQQTPDEEKRKLKMRDYLNLIQYLFKNLRNHYNIVNEVCSSLSYVQVETLIPYKDDPDGFEQIQKHTRSLMTEIRPEFTKEKDELLEKIAQKDEELRKVTNDLRNFVYEINTMLHASKSA